MLNLLLVGFGEHLPHDGERGAGGRPARVEGEMRDRLDDLVAGDAVLQRLPEVERKFVLAIACDQAGDRDENPGDARRRRTTPGR
jgi:hypothetical protein